MQTMSSRTRTILQMCKIDNDSASVSDSNNSTILSSPAPIVGNGGEAVVEVTRQYTGSGETSASEEEPFEDSGDEYIPTGDADDTDTNEEEFENDAPLVVSATKILSKSGRGRKKQNKEEATRKRKRNSSTWTRNVRKLLRTQGKEYVSVSGNKVIRAKELKAACICRKKCFEKFTHDERQSLFTSFYKLSSSGQNQFIAHSIDEEEKSVQRLRHNVRNRSRRKFTRRYFMTNSNGTKIEVCQVMFLNTFDVTLKKARVVVEKKRSSGSKICSEDKRGKHGNHPKIPENDRLSIKEHINLFPAYESHYSRSHTQKKYLASDLSIAHMYRLYTQFCQERNIVPKSVSLYRKIFVEDFNLSFHKPKNDTCAKCDQFVVKLKCCENETERISIEAEKNEHLRLADTAYASKREDKEKCPRTPGYVTVSFDLQQCLPTPYLRSGLSFYKRQLWTFNLTIYQTVGKESSALCYLWNETLAGRGGQEIASCIYHYLHDLVNNRNIHTVVLYSDSCGGQNRNIYFTTMLLQTVCELKAKGKNLTIHHKFLEAGHTHLEADTIHAAIEKVKKHTTAEIELPRDWANLIRSISRKTSIRVIELEQHQFLDFKSCLKTYYVHRKKNILNEPIQWLKIKWMQYSTNTENILYKHSFDGNFKMFNISRNANKTRQALLPILQPLNNELLPLSREKLQDLRALLPYINKNSRPYYNYFLEQLAADDNTVDTFPDEIIEEDSEEFSE